MRFRQTTESGSRKIRFWEYFEVTAIYNMATGLLPFGTGEISYPYLMKRGHDVRVTQSASTLLVTRLADLISISLLFFVAILLLSDDLIVSGDVMLMIGGVLLIASLCLAFAPWVGDRLLDILEQWSTRLLGTARSGLAARVFQAGRHFVVRMRAIVIRPRELAGLFFYSFTIWLLCYWFFQLILYGLGYPFTFWMAAFSGSLVLLTNLLPVPAIAGLGVRQIGWLLALVAMGFDTEEAVTLGFSVHLISLSYMILLGLSGLGSLFVRQMILNGKA